jgi:hypothetical protein
MRRLEGYGRGHGLDGGRGSASAIQVDDSLDPGDIVGHLGVDTVFAALAAALAETGDAENGPAVAHLAEQRSARITGARIDAPLAVAGAKHVLRDEIIFVHFATG